jgi:tetratricopeptide (TPR) repeat protein
VARAAPTVMRARIALALLLTSCALPPDALAADPEAARLLERAEFWQSRARDDLAREELAKVLRLAPDDAEALAMLARLQLRANQDRDATATLERLRKAHPDHPAAGQLATLLRIRGVDKEKLRQARQLARAGRSDEAVTAYRAIFPDGFPDDELALEYARALAATGSARETGAKLIAELARKHPDDPRFQVAWASDLSTRRPVARSTLRSLRNLAAVPGVARQALEAWRLALLGMDATEESAELLREYIAAYPGDTALREKLEQVTRATAAVRRQRDDPGYRARREGMEALEAGRLDEAGPLLERAISVHPDDGEALGAMGLLRLKQGRHLEALDLFQRAQRAEPKDRTRWTGLERTARYWGLLQQAREARAAGAFADAEARAREAMSLDPAEPAGEAELARIHLAIKSMRARARALQAERRTEEAIAALEEGLALEPRNPWLAHDLARLYAERGDPARGEALFAQLLQRAPGEADVRYAMALFLSSIDREADAIPVLDAIPAAQRSEGMTRLRQELEMTLARRASAAPSRTSGARSRSSRATKSGGCAGWPT